MDIFTPLFSTGVTRLLKIFILDFNPFFTFHKAFKSPKLLRLSEQSIHTKTSSKIKEIWAYFKKAITEFRLDNCSFKNVLSDYSPEFVSLTVTIHHFFKSQENGVLYNWSLNLIFWWKGESKPWPKLFRGVTFKSVLNLIKKTCDEIIKSWKKSLDFFGTFDA